MVGVVVTGFIVTRWGYYVSAVLRYQGTDLKEPYTLDSLHDRRDNGRDCWSWPTDNH